jgi:hypothetical protein
VPIGNQRFQLSFEDPPISVAGFSFTLPDEDISLTGEADFNALTSEGTLIVLPEPSTVGLCGIGALCVFGYVLRWRKRAA